MASRTGTGRRRSRPRTGSARCARPGRARTGPRPGVRRWCCGSTSAPTRPPPAPPRRSAPRRRPARTGTGRSAGRSTDARRAAPGPPRAPAQGRSRPGSRPPPEHRHPTETARHASRGGNGRRSSGPDGAWRLPSSRPAQAAASGSAITQAAATPARAVARALRDVLARPRHDAACPGKIAARHRVPGAARDGAAYISGALTPVRVRASTTASTTASTSGTQGDAEPGSGARSQRTSPCAVTDGGRAR